MTTWKTDTGSLISIFRSALVALVPVADAARIPWRDADAYDDWDEIARILFSQIVVRSLEWAGVGTSEGFTFPPYGIRLTDYSRHHLIGVTTTEVRERLAFVALTTGHNPFDTVACRPLDPAGTRPIGDEVRIAVSDATFHVERRGAGGLTPVADELEVEL